MTLNATLKLSRGGGLYPLLFPQSISEGIVFFRRDIGSVREASKQERRGGFEVFRPLPLQGGRDGVGGVLSLGFRQIPPFLRLHQGPQIQTMGRGTPPEMENSLQTGRLRRFPPLSLLLNSYVC